MLQLEPSLSRVLELEIGQYDRARARARTIYFPTRASLTQDFSVRVELELELELDCYLNELISDRQYSRKIGSFTPLCAHVHYLLMCTCALFVDVDILVDAHFVNVCCVAACVLVVDVPICTYL
jgi:hypothetical protein